MDQRKARIALIPIFMVIFIDNFGFAMIFNMLGPLFLEADYGLVSPSMSQASKNILIAIGYGVYPFTQFFAAPIIGDLADHFGRKVALYLSLIGLAIGFLLSGFAIMVHSILFLLLSRLISGVFAGNQGIALAAIADLSPSEKARGKNYAIVTTLYGVSWILSMTLGGYLANPKFMGVMGPPLAFFFCGAFTMFNLIAVWLWFKETHKTSEEFHFDLFEGIKHVIKAFEIPGVSLYFLIYLLWTIGWGMGVQWFSPFAIEIYQATTFETTTWYIILGVFWTFGSSVGNQILLKYFRSFSIAMVGNFVITAFLLFIGFAKHFFTFALLLSIASMFSAFILSNTMNLISMKAPESYQGKVMGLTSSMMAFGWILTSIIALMLAAGRIKYLYLLCGCILAVVSLLFVARFFSGKEKLD